MSFLDEHEEAPRRNERVTCVSFRLTDSELARLRTIASSRFEVGDHADISLARKLIDGTAHDRA